MTSLVENQILLKVTFLTSLADHFLSQKMDEEPKDLAILNLSITNSEELFEEEEWGSRKGGGGE